MKNFFLKTGLTLLCLIVGLGSAWGDTVTTYTFSDKSWKASPANWTSGKAGNGFTSGQGVQVTTGVTGANATSPKSFSNVSKIVVTYCTNVKAGKGTVTLKVGSTEFGSQAITAPSSGGTTLRTFELTNSNNLSGTVNINVACGTNSIYIYSIEITEASGTTKTLSSIAVKTAPTKTTYTEGEYFDPTGLVITGTYSDSSTEDIAYAGHESDFTFSPALSTALTTSNTSVTITYSGKSTTQSITVNEAPKHTANFYSNGSLYTSEQYTEGAAITFPTGLAAINGKNFVGWVAAEISGTTDTAPSFVTSANMCTSDVTYFAVYAKDNSSSSGYLEKLDGGSTLYNGDRIAIFANTNNKYYGMRHETISTSYVNFYVLNSAPTYEDVIADNKNWWTLNADADGKWKLGDKTDGYLANNSNNLVANDQTGTPITIAWNSTNNKYTIKNDSRWIGCRSDLTGENQYKFRGAGTSNTPQANSTCYLDIYRISGGTSYSGYCTTVSDEPTPPVDSEIPDFIKTPSIELTVGADPYDVRQCLNIPSDYDTSTYAITTTIDGITQKDNEYACVYPYIAFQKADTYTVHVVAAAMPGKYAQTEGNITVNVTAPAAPITTIPDLFTKATEVSGTDTDINITFNNWVVSGVKGSNVYVTDGTNGFIIYQSNHGFTAGDVLNGTVDCKVKLYNGAAEIVGLTSTTIGLTVSTSAEELTPTVISDITTLSGVNTGALIKINNVQYNGTNFTDGTNNIKPYTSIMTSLPELTNGAYYNVTGVYVQYNTTKEIAPRSAEDVEEIQAEKYAINIAACTNGTVTASLEEAAEGVEVTLTVTPDSGYQLSNLTVTNASTSEAITVTGNKFIMPESDVEVEATFEEKGAQETLYLDFDFINHPIDWPIKATAAAGTYTYTLDGEDYDFSMTKSGDGIYLSGTSGTSGYLLMASGNKLGLPALEGYKLTKVVGQLNNSGMPSVMSVVSVTDGTNVVSGGDGQTWDTKGGLYTYNLSDTEENTVYYLATSEKNCQMINLKLTYEKMVPLTTITISEFGATTLSLDKAYIMPEGLTGKTISVKEKADEGCYTLTYTTKYNAGDVVPAGEALVVQGEPGNHHAYKGTTTESATSYPDNLLRAEYNEDSSGKWLTNFTNEVDNYYYKLTTKSGANFGWYWGAESGAPFLMSRNDRAYLVIAKEIAAGVRGFTLADGEEEDLTTFIEGLTNEETNNSGRIYNLQGQMMNKLQKGFNIVNGKKIIR